LSQGWLSAGNTPGEQEKEPDKTKWVHVQTSSRG